MFFHIQRDVPKIRIQGDVPIVRAYVVRTLYGIEMLRGEINV